MRKALSIACVVLCLPFMLMGMSSEFRAPALAQTDFAPPLPSPPADSTALPPAPIAVVATFLNFSPEQADQFQAILSPFLDTLKGLQQQKIARQQALQQLLDTPNPDPQTIVTLVLQIHAIEQQQQQVIAAFHQAFVALLTSEQLQKVEAVSQAAQLIPVVGAFQALYLVPPPVGPQP